MNKLSTTLQTVKNLHEHSATIFLVLLLIGDLTYIALHLVEKFTPFLQNSLLSIERDRGYAEMYQYLKLIWIAILFFYISLQKKFLGYMAWVLVFTYFFFDDALHIHELLGEYIAGQFSITHAFGLRMQDYGELTVSAIAGISLLSLVAWAYRRGSQDFKNKSKDILLLIGALIFFGVVVDMAHIAIQVGWLVTFILGVIEDGGEMVVVTLILWYTFLLSMRHKTAKAYLCDLIPMMLKPRRFRSHDDQAQPVL